MTLKQNEMLTACYIIERRTATEPRQKEINQELSRLYNIKSEILKSGGLSYEP